MSKIMLVDDNKRILELLGTVMRKAGHDVIVADSGATCLEILKDEKPDLILMDVMMPEMDGWKTVEAIKKDPSNRDIIICMLTVKSREMDKAKSLEDVGADFHIAKPVTNEVLLQEVSRMLEYG